MRERGTGIVPYCSAVRHFIDTHAAYLPLVPKSRPAFGGSLWISDVERL